MDFLFLPPEYFVALVASAIVTGLIFDYISRTSFLLATAALFGVFTISQFIFRYLTHTEPERLLGQTTYFILFLFLVFLTKKIKDRFIG